MSINRHKPHVLVLPEDDANRQLANGFLRDPSLAPRCVQILPPAGGWLKALNRLETGILDDMRRYPYCFLVLLIDFDGDAGRASAAVAKAPDALKDQVFVLGALKEPEDLKRANLGTFEQVGRDLARECREGTSAVWNHSLLIHNAAELTRLRQSVRPFLFISPTA